MRQQGSWGWEDGGGVKGGVESDGVQGARQGAGAWNGALAGP
jgi:hypothetical protein